ncbi:ATP synthase subunit H protein (Va0H) (atp6H) (Atp6v0e) [Salvia divinorum]|uniref:ATP synthase subunit H protein (Va0H) (Atp6H) (Atp6v0e) n=1 Tax=Salvia divinorum TaxID=28513 RepID=A0ABD1GPL4_SALDI
MRKFDPWPVFFKREWNRCWPFLVGFGVTATIVTKMSLSLTEEEAAKSPFVQRHRKTLAPLRNKDIQPVISLSLC